MSAWMSACGGNATSITSEEAIERAQKFNGTANADWTPFEHTFEDGVPMVLVPAGCFQMGSDSGGNDVQPFHEQCFDKPFWMDKFEVTQADFERLGGKKANENAFIGATLPVEQITWFEIQSFCELRGMRLPTEREWEYVARGVESLVYPWGNEFVGENLVYHSNSGSKTAPVGSRSSGSSWVGAMDLSGNVREWVLSEYKPYPYEKADGREDNLSSSDVRRGLRGGSWLYVTTNLRSASRYDSLPDFNYSSIGGRCARVIP